MTMPERRTIVIHPKLLGAIAEAASTDEGRRTLNMVVFSRHEVVACNGHIAVRYRFEDPLDESFPTFGLERRHVEAIARAAQFVNEARIGIPEGPAPFAEVSFSQQSTMNDVRIAVPRLIAKDYPPLDAVIPRGPAGAPPTGIAYDPRYLDLIYRIVKCAAFDRSVRVISWSNGDPKWDLRTPTMYEAGPKHGEHSALRIIIMPVAPADGPFDGGY